MAGDGAKRMDRAAAVTRANTFALHGTAGPTLGASATRAVIARTCTQSRRICVAPGGDPRTVSHPKAVARLSAARGGA